MPSSKMTVMIGSGEHTVACTVPRIGIGFFEGVALTTRGWWDAVRNRPVPDTNATHTVHWLQSKHRRREAEAVGRINAALIAIDRELAQLNEILAQPAASSAPVPTSEDLAALPAGERSEWAARVRAARAANAHAASASQRRSEAAARQAEMLAVRSGILVGSRDVSALWREAYEMRAARYTRARFVRWGGRLTEAPSIAAYVPAGSPIE